MNFEKMRLKNGIKEIKKTKNIMRSLNSKLNFYIRKIKT